MSSEDDTNKSTLRRATIIILAFFAVMLVVFFVWMFRTSQTHSELTSVETAQANQYKDMNLPSSTKTVVMGNGSAPATPLLTST